MLDDVRRLPLSIGLKALNSHITIGITGSMGDPYWTRITTNLRYLEQFYQHIFVVSFLKGFHVPGSNARFFFMENEMMNDKGEEILHQRRRLHDEDVWGDRFLYQVEFFSQYGETDWYFIMDDDTFVVTSTIK